MKIKTSELIGPALDWVVAKCLWPHKDYPAWWFRDHPDGCYLWEALDGGDGSVASFSPSTKWAQGGVLIEREKINVVRCNDMYFPKGNEFGDYYEQLWRAGPYDIDSISQRFYGPTPLIAAMRCYCCAELGDEVEIPEELE